MDIIPVDWDRNPEWFNSKGFGRKFLKLTSFVNEKYPFSKLNEELKKIIKDNPA